MKAGDMLWENGALQLGEYASGEISLKPLRSSWDRQKPGTLACDEGSCLAGSDDPVLPVERLFAGVAPSPPLADTCDRCSLPV